MYVAGDDFCRSPCPAEASFLGSAFDVLAVVVFTLCLDLYLWWLIEGI
jgi:hypothetical protein